MCKAKNLVTSIEVDIDAPASLVWEVLTDLERYPQWNPFCPRIESTLKLGDPVHMHISVPGTSETQPVSETLVACEPQRLLSWEMRPTAENKDAARRDQYIEALGSDRCRYVTTDIFLGVNADEIMRNHGGWVKAGFDAMALALKARAEALRGGSR
ncbi:MAG: SRPBCC domain-containing protein [Betaproteobacteria bacterium]|nr:MAG: SRPBCC domain-containing protein [Betaproteobacteria bacterium]